MGNGGAFIQRLSSLQSTQSTFTFTHKKALGTKAGFSILREDTSTCRLEEPGIEPPKYLLSNSRHRSDEHLQISCLV